MGAVVGAPWRRPRRPGIRIRAAGPRGCAPPLPGLRGARLDDPGGVADPGSGAGGVAGIARPGRARAAPAVPVGPARRCPRGGGDEPRRRPCVRPRGRRGGRPLCLLDLAVPRDVEPAVGQLENVFLYDIDDLQAVAAQAAAQRRGEIPAAERIVSEEVERFWGWYDGLGVVPVIRAFRDRLDDLRRTELERTLRRLDHLSPEDRAQVDQFSQALLNKFLHEPTVVLKRAARVGHGYGLLEALKKLFGLETGAGQ